MLAQFRQLRKMGNVKDVLALIPGFSQITGGAQVDEREFAHMEAIISSMTKDERARPEIIEASRRNRIARGSGTGPGDVAMVLKQYREMKQLFTGKGKLAGMFGGLLRNMGVKLPGGRATPGTAGPGASDAGNVGGGKAPFGGPSRERREELREMRRKEKRKKKR